MSVFHISEIYKLMFLKLIKAITECLCLESGSGSWDSEPFDKSHSKFYALLSGQGCTKGEVNYKGKDSYKGQGHNEQNEWIGDYIDEEQTVPYFDTVHKYCWFYTNEVGFKRL